MPADSGRPVLVEHEYERKSAWAYLAAYDVRRGKSHGRFELKSGIAPFNRLVTQVMRQEPVAKPFPWKFTRRDPGGEVGSPVGGRNSLTPILRSAALALPAPRPQHLEFPSPRVHVNTETHSPR